MRYKKFTIKHICFFLCLSVWVSLDAHAQLTVAAGQPAAVLAAKLAGPGITISSPVLTCATVASGTFVSVLTPLSIDSGIILTSGKAVSAIGTESSLASTNNGTAGDATLTILAGTSTYDACILEFDFIPNGDTVSFNYQFGSEEYTHSTCSEYNDPFAFFISGPGIAGVQNMALIPGTTIPVTANSVNSGVPGTAPSCYSCSLSNCTSMGPGSPFTTDFVDNTGGTMLTYKGFTTKFAAVHDVIPCSTYHLKMAISDASNGLYDSGVFIEAGSLKTNTFSFSRADSIGATINGVPHSIVKGCASASISVLSGHPSGTPQTIHFIFAGSAVSGTDFAVIADSVTIPAGDSVATIIVSGLPTIPSGVKTLELYLESPFSCGGIVDSIGLNILDSPYAILLTPDTSICIGQSILIQSTASTGLLYNWSPAISLDDPTLQQPTATPIANTTYTMTAVLPNSGCMPIVNNLTIAVSNSAITLLTPDTTICNGASVNINLSGSATVTYNWSPAAGLNDPTLQDPIATPSVTTTYSVIAGAPGGGCPSTASFTITVGSPAATILTHDTTICNGASVNISVTGSPSLSYSWSPAAGLNNSGIMQPVATPTTNTTYILTATAPGTPCFVSQNLTINVVSVSANAGTDISACAGTSVQLNVTGTAAYSYLWAGPSGFTATSQNPVIAAITGTYTVTVTDILSGCKAQDSEIVVTTTPPPPIVLPSVNVCQGQVLTLEATGENLEWYIDPLDTSRASALSTPNTSTLGNYFYYVSQTVNNCTSARAGIYVQVVPCCDGPVFIPSAFTPNKDGQNDEFTVVRGPNFIIDEFLVFNRWGQIVFKGDNANDKWDGTFNGAPSDIGTYYYSLTYTCRDGNTKSIQKKGDVVLIR